MRIFIISVTAFLIGGHLFASVIKDDVNLKDQKEYTLKEVCGYFYKQDYPLIEIKSVTRLDCMKGEVEVGSFCKKKQSEDPFLIRGFIDKNKKKVICQSARRVIFKYNCAKDPSQKCMDSSIGCYIFRDQFAIRLKITHHSLTPNEKGQKVLSCYFEARNLDELKL